MLQLSCYRIQSADVYRVTSNKGENEIKGNLQSCTCHFFMTCYGLPCSHIVYVATEMEICLPQQAFNSCWKVEKIPSQEASQIEEPTNDSITVKMKRTKAKSFTREQLWVEANELAKEWANTLTNLPIPAFQGQLNAMKHLIECAKNNITINFNEKIRPTEEKEATNLVNEQFMQIAIPNSTACETHKQLALNMEDDITKMAKELNSNQHNIDEQQQMETEVQQITEVVNELVVVPDVKKKRVKD
ncbi:uncharacterized protein LOC124209921 [Daphnia pulex]|uniref:uncharacterized protein LOC124209921 n=1 Tax=Daphnia pulex TaxID=6669 RepID=UPI001EE07278|nr:uncharacterized protein LOC124209921 [Daphnia pulex]